MVRTPPIARARLGAAVPLVAAALSLASATGPAAPAGASTPLNAPAVGTAPTPTGGGYWLVAADGGVFSFGDARFFGSMGGRPLNEPVVGMAGAPDGGGYWLVARDGGVFSFGDARFFGSMGGQPLNAPVASMAPTPDGGGYWLVARDGGVFAFGDAGFYGSMGGEPLNAPVVGMAPTPDGGGYWEVASDGGIFTFGDARFFGSMGGRPLNEPAVGMAAAPDGGGYWLVAADGGVFSFGDARFFGSMGGQPLNAPAVSMAPTPGGGGYWLVARDGGVFSFGDAGYFGSLADRAPRIALYGDSLAMEAAADFSFFASLSGAPTLVRAYGGLAVCDLLPAIAADAATWHPSVAVIQFSGNNLSPCMTGYAIGTPAYYDKYRQDTQTAIDLLRGDGVRVVVIGNPLDATPVASQNVLTLNQISASLATATPGVTYADAGQSVLADGQFTWTLPCLSFEPCAGPGGTSTVRSPDGVHFCPSGNTTIEGFAAVCDVYSSGALRFALAMLGPALGS